MLSVSVTRFVGLWPGRSGRAPTRRDAKVARDVYLLTALTHNGLEQGCFVLILEFNSGYVAILTLNTASIFKKYRLPLTTKRRKKDFRIQ